MLGQFDNETDRGIALVCLAFCDDLLKERFKVEFERKPTEAGTDVTKSYCTEPSNRLTQI